MSQIRTELKRLQDELKGTPARLVAISKYHPAEAITEAYEAGQRVFGESHVQELCQKQPILPSDIEWHFIGHLQTNKVKYIAPFVTLIHSVDSLKLLKEIDRQGEKHDRTIDCLLQIHIAQEETKFGFLPEELDQLLESGELNALPHIRIKGIMGMATNTDNERQIRDEFHRLHSIFVDARNRYFSDSDYFCELSMGMSDDYKIALDEGSTLIRVGSKIFGQRVY